MLEEVTIEKLVHGGQGLGELSDGKKVFVWNALPDETVRVRITKNRKDYCEGVAEKVIEASDYRLQPKDEAYLSTSPWQIITFEHENELKKQILTETLDRENVAYQNTIDFVYDDTEWQYRNKMEYSFWADESGLSLALFNRGTHQKVAINGSSIAKPEIDKVAQKILHALNQNNIRGSQLKTIIVRCSQEGEVVAALFVKDDNFPKIDAIRELCKGIQVCYSTPKSPASVVTKVLYGYGDSTLTDKIMGVSITYDVHSFFQVNVPVFELAVKKIDYYLGGAEKVDLYCGVGSIGLPIGMTKVFVDIDETNCAFARRNVGRRGEVVRVSSENALEHIDENRALIVDPPRAGLHKKLVDKINEVKPPAIAYLSCNPSTQARDIKLLEDNYMVKKIIGYNFFPRTPHIESLAVMIRK